MSILLGYNNDIDESSQSGLSEVHLLLNKFNARRQNRRLSPQPKQITSSEVPEYRAQLKKTVFYQNRNVETILNDNSYVDIYKKKSEKDFIVNNKEKPKITVAKRNHNNLSNETQLNNFSSTYYIPTHSFLQGISYLVFFIKKISIVLL